MVHAGQRHPALDRVEISSLWPKSKGDTDFTDATDSTDRSSWRERLNPHEPGRFFANGLGKFLKPVPGWCAVHKYSSRLVGNGALGAGERSVQSVKSVKSVSPLLFGPRAPGSAGVTSQSQCRSLAALGTTWAVSAKVRQCRCESAPRLLTVSTGSKAFHSRRHLIRLCWRPWAHPPLQTFTDPHEVVS